VTQIWRGFLVLGATEGFRVEGTDPLIAECFEQLGECSFNDRGSFTRPPHPTYASLVGLEFPSVVNDLSVKARDDTGRSFGTLAGIDGWWCVTTSSAYAKKFAEAANAVGPNGEAVLARWSKEVVRPFVIPAAARKRQTNLKLRFTEAAPSDATALAKKMQPVDELHLDTQPSASGARSVFLLSEQGPLIVVQSSKPRSARSEAHGTMRIIWLSSTLAGTPDDEAALLAMVRSTGCTCDL